MPHKDYIRRSDMERQRHSASGGAGPSANKQRPQTAGQQTRSPRDETNHTSRGPSLAQEPTRGQGDDGGASDAYAGACGNDNDSHRARLERKLQNFRRRSSPGSVSGGKHVARRTPLNGVSPYRYASAKKASHDAVKTETGTVGEHQKVKSETSSPQEQRISQASGDNAQSASDGVIDLTVDSSDDDDEIVDAAPDPPAQGKSEDETANEPALPQASSKVQIKEGNGGEKPKAAPVKSTAAPKKKGTKKNTATKAVSCSLTGTLHFSEEEGVLCHVIRGLWQYENRDSTPERFVLRRDIPSDCKPIPLMAGGVFSGSFIFQWGPKGEPKRSMTINESEVNISFAPRDSESTSFDLNGSGQNDSGRFDLVGIAWQTSLESYNIQMRKTYTEAFQSQVLPQQENEETSESKKRKFAAVDEEPEAASDQGNGKQSSNEGPLPRAISTSNSPQESDVYSTPGNDKSASGKLVLEQTELGSAGAKIGALQSSSLNIHATSWTVRNVKPKYSPMILQFFDSVGIVYTQDILSADTEQLCSKLLAFDGFKCGCAWAAWRSRVASPPNKRKTFRDWYSAAFARKNILRWKEGAGAWYKKMAPAEPVARSETAAVVEARDGSQVGEERAVSEASSATEDDAVPLESILSSQEVYALKNHCNIITSKELLQADRSEIASRLAEFVSSNFRGRPENEIRCIAEGMVYSWLLRADEASHVGKSAGGEISPVSLGGPVLSIQSSSAASKFETPLSYVDLQFVKLQRIASDDELSKSDTSVLARGYAAYLEKTFKHIISPAAASEATTKWRQDARLIVGAISREEVCDIAPPQKTRLDTDYSGDMMNCVPNLCKTVVDEQNGGLPQKTIVTYDGENHVLYEFLVVAKESQVAKGAGNGAFLTYKGAKVLKSSSRWKIKKKSPRTPQTRKPLEAVFSISGATVTLSGAKLHGDEQHYGPESDNSVGWYNEFTAADFVDDEDNITFSSNHLGCALIELDRYAPLLPEDRKTDMIFGLKDFVFSHEPSSWRFDVCETIRGHDQVVDFTCDTTGAPHDVARKQMAMYVNEVGHNPRLVENVRGLGTSRSVSYYIHIDKPMAKGERVELLVNYKDEYESMRERRGYGKANLTHGVKSDACDITRMQRNLKDRRDVEECLSKYTEEDIHEVIAFFKTRVMEGLDAATSAFGSQDQNPHLLRQCIARRRMHWLSLILRKRLYYELMGASTSSADLNDTDASASIFQKDMLVYVNDWPQNNPRPPYTGLATITNVLKDKLGRPEFEVLCCDSTYIESVPEAVVTMPTEEDFKDSPSRTYAHWLKWKKNNEELPQTRQKRLRDIDVDWDPSFLRSIPVESQSKVLGALRWELSEELLHLLLQNKRLSQPFDEEVWCPLSVSLLVKGLHLVSDCLLTGREKQGLCNELMELARDAANAIRNAAQSDADQDSLSDLAFLRKSSGDRVVVLESLQQNRMAIGNYVKDPQPLDLELYLTEQVVLIVHPLATLIDWGSSPIYSLEKLRDFIGLSDASYLNFYSGKVGSYSPLISPVRK